MAFRGDFSQPQNRMSGGNGGIYDGKPRGPYFAYVPGSPCSSGNAQSSPPPNAIIEYVGDLAFQTKSNCQVQAPTWLPPELVLFSEHDTQVISYNGLHYESQWLTPAPSVVFARHVLNMCRGALGHPTTGTMQLLDVVIRGDQGWTTATPQYTAEVVTAPGPIGQSVYRVEVSPEVLIDHVVDPGGNRIFTDSSGSGLRLSVAPDNQADVSVDVNGVLYSGKIACDFEPVGINLLTSSERFDQLPWVYSPGLTITNNAGLAPDGSLNATLLDDVGVNLSFIGYNAYAVPTYDREVRTFSMHIKRGSAASSQMSILCHLGSSEVFAVLTWDWNADGSPSFTGIDPLVLAHGAQAIGNGWYRFWLTTANNGAGNYEIETFIYPRPGTGPDASDNGSIYVWGAQLENGLGPPGPYQAR